MMFRHSDGWALNTVILRIVTTTPPDVLRRRAEQSNQDPEQLPRIVREEIATDRDLVWC